MSSPHASQLRFVETISPNDRMLVPGREQQYYSWGLAAIEYLEAVTPLCHCRTPPASILDLPCGHGRVLRMFKARYPEAELTACDIDPDAVAFCASTFGARPILAKKAPKEIVLPRLYDLIWVGSLLTHYDAPSWNGFLQLLASHLEPHGVLALTTNGRLASRNAQVGNSAWPLTLSDATGLFDSFDRDGFAFRAYPEQVDYGISLATLSQVCAELERIPGLLICAATEGGWNGRQDIVVAVRSDSAPSRPLPSLP